jgi:hypothetical protein
MLCQFIIEYICNYIGDDYWFEIWYGRMGFLGLELDFILRENSDRNLGGI